MMPSFTSNGLLGLTPSTSQDIPKLPLNHNGVLESSLSEVVLTVLDMDSQETCASMELQHSSCLSFKPTGLLDRTVSTEDPSRTEFELMSNQSTQIQTISFGIPCLLGSTSLTNSTANASQNDSTVTNLVDQCITTQTFDGKSVYFRRRIKKRKEPQLNTSSSTSSSICRLLDVPIHRMLENLSACIATRLQQSEPESLSTVTGNNIKADTLWVDRYRPSRFTELLGNERIARETLGWIKQWDWCVFGKRPKNNKKGGQEEDFEALDEFHRPQQKVLLLSGPPGLGKTTLAHVVARQAGYEVMEINASDARTGSVVDDRIRPALESGSAIGKKKPVLLVIDEIDGATGAGDNSSSFITKLVHLILHKPKKKRGADPNRGPQAKPPLLRPIICICNDVNASSLTKLRPHAYHLRYMRPADMHIVNRLRHICETECLSVESRALSMLVGVAKGDLRGCLNTLQFLKSRCKHVTEAAVRHATAGMKEADVSLNAILTDIFSPLSKKRVHELGLCDDEEFKYVSRLGAEIEGSGRENSIAIGCFAQYPKMRQHEANLSRYERANEWLITYDCFSAAMYSDGEFALLHYLPYTLVPFYPLFSERGAQAERSQADWEYLQVTRTNEEIYKSMSRGLRNATANSDYRHLLTSPTLALEFAPYINRIISPPIKPINSQVVRSEERAVLTRLVEIMMALDLRFVQERAEDAQLTYRLDPPIDVFVTYDGRRAADLAISRYAVRQLVANEISAKSFSHEANAVDGGKGSKWPSTAAEATPDGELGPPNKRARVIAEATAVDFFGRPIVRAQKDASKTSEKAKTAPTFRVTYRFAEGNSAAVRKPIKVGAFL